MASEPLTTFEIKYPNRHDRDRAKKLQIPYMGDSIIDVEVQLQQMPVAPGLWHHNRLCLGPGMYAY